eukprot:765257-Alexandrium_andersonii.AAC.1
MLAVHLAHMHAKHSLLFTRAGRPSSPGAKALGVAPPTRPGRFVAEGRQQGGTAFLRRVAGRP